MAAEDKDAPKADRHANATTDKDADKAVEKSDDKGDKPVKADKADQPAKADKADEPVKADKADQPAKADKADQPAKADKADQPVKADKADQPAKADKTDDQPTKTDDAEAQPALLTVASSPHVRSGESTTQIMWTVFACLLPATIWGMYLFGLSAAIVLATCTGGAVVFEALAQWLMGRRNTVQDGSAALTGLLLGLTMPPTASVYLCLVGAFVAVVVSKAVFGGLGHNPFNPALTARVFLLIAFPGPMTKWAVPSDQVGNRIQSLYGQSTTWLNEAGKPLDLAQAKTGADLSALADKVDVITAATPLAVAKEHWKAGTEQVAQHFDFLVGSMPGSLGEVSALLLLAGAAVLFWRKIITWHIPVSFLLGVIAVAGLTHLANPTRYMDPLWHIFTGGIIIGAFFMATDYVTSPTYPVGMIIFGLGCGLLTMIIRLWGGFPEGVSFAILIMNAFTPLIERVTRPKKFGHKPWAEPETG